MNKEQSKSKKPAHTKEQKDEAPNAIEEPKESKQVSKDKKDAAVKKQPKKKKVKSAKHKIVITKGRRKASMSRAIIKEGKGRITINKDSIDSIQNNYFKQFLSGPLMFLGNKASKIDVKIQVSGGGKMGRLQAARTALARGLVEYFEDENLKELMEKQDRYLLGDDIRRVEPKKDRARKARAKYQKSYR